MRHEAAGTKIKRRRSLAAVMEISKKLAETAKLEAETDPKKFPEYLTIDIYIEAMLSSDADVRMKAAKEMLAYTLQRKKSESPGKSESDPKVFKPEIPERKEKQPLPQHVQDKILQIKTKTVAQ